VTLGAEKGKPHGNETLYEVAAPYGSNLVVATTSAEPLFKAPRPQLEQAGDYLGALRAAMAAQQGGAERPMSYYRYLETAAP
jgi:hypothetical protein